MRKIFATMLLGAGFIAAPAVAQETGAPGGLYVGKEMKLGHALGYADEAEALIAQGRPDGNTGKSISRHRALDTDGSRLRAWAGPG